MVKAVHKATESLPRQNKRGLDIHSGSIYDGDWWFNIYANRDLASLWGEAAAQRPHRCEIGFFKGPGQLLGLNHHSFHLGYEINHNPQSVRQDK